MPIRLFNSSFTEAHEAHIIEREHTWVLCISNPTGRVTENSIHKTEQDLLAQLICLMERNNWVSDVLSVNDRKADKAFEDFYDEEV